MGDQQSTNRAAVEAVREFLGGPWPDGDAWTFQLAEHLCSNWGAVYGGASAAVAVSLARLTAPDYSPRSLHLQMLRPLPPGTARGAAKVRHRGRTVATIETELHDGRGNLAAAALVTCVVPESLARDFSGTRADPFDLAYHPIDLGDYQAAIAPIAFALKMPGVSDGPITITNLPPSITGDPARCLTIESPWRDVTTTSPELACLIADATNGLPIIHSLSSLGPVSWPNTDLSLRFTSAPADNPVLAAGTLVSVADGTTIVLINVQAGGRWLAHGHSTSVLLPVAHTDGRPAASSN